MSETTLKDLGIILFFLVKEKTARCIILIKHNLYVFPWSQHGYFALLIVQFSYTNLTKFFNSLIIMNTAIS